MTAGPPCPLCGGTAPKKLAREWRGYRLYDCGECGLGFCDPFKNPGSRYYEENLDLYGARVQETTDPLSFEYDEGLAVLARELPRGARLLDVGCGAGGFLHRARSAGFSASGADFNSARARALRARGFDVFEGGLPDLVRRGVSPFDAVTIFEVLEHVDDPNAWLSAARAALKPGGLFVVAVPNRDRAFDPFQGPGLEEIDNPPHHLTRWSAAALSGALERNGFRVEECRPLGYPLPMLQLLLRNTLRFGLATRAMNVDQLCHAPATAGAPAKQSLIRSLVAAKEAAINAAARTVYPAFRAAARARGWQGAILLAVGHNPRTEEPATNPS